MKKKWYLQTWFISILFACWFLYGIPLIIGIILLFVKNREDKKLLQQAEQAAQLQEKLNAIGATEYFEVKQKVDSMNEEISTDNAIVSRLREEISSLNTQNEKLSKQLSSQTNKLSRIKELYKSIEHCIDNFLSADSQAFGWKLSTIELEESEAISPSVMLKLHCMDVKDLRKAYRDNQKQITALLEQYSSRYTTKANKSIYNLMIIALQAEIQNILYNLKYEKLDKSIEDVKRVSAKYLKIAGEGNQTIAGTLTKFIGEIEYFYINAIKIEYNYYVKKEQSRQEQLAIKEQMRHEAEERKALESEKKKVEKEEAKYKAEIDKLQSTIQAGVSESELELLKARILALEGQLADVVLKKEEITNLQNGKAGNVYVISNLGSFGEDIFKIGMTRRLDPQDRVNELGSASVPFKFDVHSFIFSEDAVGLENKLHELLNNKRLNKVNLRKEFFKINIDELEELIISIDPTAEFNKTMLAEEFRQSLSTNENYTSDYDLPDEEDE